MTTQHKRFIRIISLGILLCHALWVVGEYAVADGNVLRLEFTSTVNLIALVVFGVLSKTRED